MTTTMTENPTSSQDNFREDVINCLSQQIGEFEVLKSMYPNEHDIKLTDINILKNINDFLNNASEYIPNHLDYTIKITFNNFKMEVSVNLPTLYPKEEPDIYVRCNQLNRQQETMLNVELTNYIKENQLGDVCLYNAISWLQDNLETYANKGNDEKSTLKTGEVMTKNHREVKFVRLWIYSHHIYNKKKREDITKKAKELKLTGFCLPGKPGIICVEGPDTDCGEWWRDIKSMCWKKIEVRMTDTYELIEQPKQQKFTTFEEIHFGNTGSRLPKHTDMSEFSKYMEDHGLSQAFLDIFGFCNET